MKPLFVSMDVARRTGGIQRFDQRTVRALAEISGTLPAVIGLRDDPGTLVPGTDLRIEGCGGSKLRLLRQFVRSLIRYAPDTVLFGHVMLAPLAAIARMIRPRARRILFVHGIDVWNDPAYHELTALERRAMRSWLDAIISVSQYTLDRLRHSMPDLATPQWVLPNAVDVKDPADFTPRVGSGVPQILTVSRLDEMEKGVGMMLQAIPRVVEQFGPVRYVIAGDGKIRPELERLAAETGAAAHTQFVGRVSDDELNQLYRTSDVFALPSTKEGFGIVYLEAWLRELPVVAGNVDASREVIDDGVNGLTVDPRNVDAVAGAMVKLLRDPASAAAMGRAGRQKVSAEYGHDRFVSRLRGLLTHREPHGAGDAVPGLGAVR